MKDIYSSKQMDETFQSGFCKVSKKLRSIFCEPCASDQRWNISVTEDSIGQSWPRLLNNQTSLADSYSLYPFIQTWTWHVFSQSKITLPTIWYIKLPFFFDLSVMG